MTGRFLGIGSLVALTAAGLIWTGSVRAGGYRDMTREFDYYHPPLYYYQQDRGTAAPGIEVQDPEFNAAQKSVEALKSRWMGAAGALGGGFYSPPPGLLKKLRPAAQNDQAALQALSGTFSIETLATLALLRNPGIAAARDRLRAAIDTFDQVRNVDEILRQYTAFTESLATGVGAMKGKDPAAMKYPYPGIMALQGQVVDQEVQGVLAELDAARRRAVTEARQTYWRLLFVHQATAITRQMLELLDHLEDVARTQYQAGRTSFQDVVKVTIRQATLEVQVATLKEQQKNFESKIREILNLAPAGAVGRPLDADPLRKIPPLEGLYPLALRHRQELNRLRAKVGVVERMIEMGETKTFPPFTLNLSLYEDEPVNTVGPGAVRDPFPTGVPASRGAGEPIRPWFGLDDAYLRQTKSRMAALKQDLNQAEAVTESMIREAWYQLDRTRREAELYGDAVVGLSETALNVSTKGYESGGVSFADVIESHTLWLEAHLKWEQRKQDFGVAWAALEETVGLSLD